MIKIPKSKQFQGVFGLVKGENCKYVVPGWYEVPQDTQREDIFIDDSQYFDDEPESFKEEIEFTQEVSSSKGDKTYTITKTTQGKWKCTCPAFQHQRGECKHIKQLKKNKNG